MIALRSGSPGEGVATCHVAEDVSTDKLQVSGVSATNRFDRPWLDMLLESKGLAAKDIDLLGDALPRAYALVILAPRNRWLRSFRSQACN